VPVAVAEVKAEAVALVAEVAKAVAVHLQFLSGTMGSMV
jgi:hypothetical protein